MMRPDAILRTSRLLLSVLAALGAVSVLAFFDPTSSNFFPKCLFYELTGFYCPGCGGQRAVHELINGRLLEAAGYNLLTVTYLPIAFMFLLTKVIFPQSSRSFRPHISPFLYRMIPVNIIAFWLARNIPFTPFAILAP